MRGSQALEVFTRQQHLAAVEVAAYNPLKDPDGSGAALIVELLADVLGKRLEGLQTKAPADQPTTLVSAEGTQIVPNQPKKAPSPNASPEALLRSSGEPGPQSVTPGEAWLSDDTDAAAAAPSDSADHEQGEEQSTNPGDTGDPA